MIKLYEGCIFYKDNPKIRIFSRFLNLYEFLPDKNPDKQIVYDALSDKDFKVYQRYISGFIKPND